MYKDYSDFMEIATRIVANEKIKHRKETSGIWKGEYTTFLVFPQFEKLDEKHSIKKKYYITDWDALKKYKIETYGAEFASECRYGHEKELEKGIKRLKECIAQDLRQYWRSNYKHPFSDFYKYYMKGGKAEYEGETLVLEYLKILDGKINSENWRKYKFEKETTLGAVTNFIELYDVIKKQAKEQWLSYNKYYQPKHHEAKPLNLYIFDEENIPEIAEFERALEKPKEPEKTVASQPIIKEIDKSKDTGFIKLGYRPEFLKTPILYGRERIVILANGEKHRSQFAIVELENILASHDEYSFTDTPNYPVNARGENINDRNYSGDKNAQAKVIEIAQNFEPETQISTSASAAGLPIITIDGIVVSGNNRTMSFKRMIKDYPENYKKYLKTLRDEIVTFGFSSHVGSDLILKEDIPLPGSSYHNPLSVKFETPILIRIDYDFPGYTTTEMNKYNKDTKKAERPIDRAIKLSSMLLDNESCFNIIAEIVGKYEILSDLYAVPAEINRLKKSFVECNILTEQELPAYFAENLFTAQGKEFFLNLLAGMILDKESLLASEVEGVKRLKEKIVTALPVLIKNSKLTVGSLKTDINQAIILQQKLVTGGHSLADYMRSPKLFTDQEEIFSKNAYYLNEILNMPKYTFKQSIEAYNNGILSNTGASLFGDPLTPEQIFTMTIINKIPENIKTVIEKYYQSEEIQQEPTEPEIITAKPEIDSEKAKARARLRAKLKIMKGREKTTEVFEEGGTITGLQKSQIEKINAEYSQKQKDLAILLKQAITAKNKEYDRLQSRCGLFGDTQQKENEPQLFQTDINCTKDTLDSALIPFTNRIKLIQKEQSELNTKWHKEIEQVKYQTELSFQKGGNIEQKPPIPYSQTVSYDVIQETTEESDLLIYQKVKNDARKRIISRLTKDICEKTDPPYGQIGLTYRPSEMLVSLQVRDSKSVYDYIIEYVLSKPNYDILIQEYFGCLFLNTKNVIIGYRIFHIGGIDSSVVDRRIVMATALNCLCTGIIIFHNHPSQYTEPSPADKDVTTKIAESGKIVGIKVLDHIIIGNANGKYLSFTDEGILN